MSLDEQTLARMSQQERQEAISVCELRLRELVARLMVLNETAVRLMAGGRRTQWRAPVIEREIASIEKRKLEIERLLATYKRDDGASGTGKRSGRRPARLPRTVSPESADFDATVGKWMHEAHSRLERKGVRASRGRKTPNLPQEEYRKIVKRTDRVKRNGKPRFPLKGVLPERAWKEIAQHNTKAGSAESMLSLWSDVAFRREFKKAVHYRFNRAEIYYRKHLVPRQS